MGALCGSLVSWPLNLNLGELFCYALLPSAITSALLLPAPTKWAPRSLPDPPWAFLHMNNFSRGRRICFAKEI